MGLLGKDMIEKWILPHLPTGRRGFATTAPLSDIVECIFYRLKTGCQWRELPTQAFFKDRPLSWNTVFYYWNKWSKADCRRNIWINLLKANRKHLDISSLQLDGSHTPAKNGGEAVAYQERKSCRTTNALFASDNQGGMLAMAAPQAGNHHDLFGIKQLFEQICGLLKQAGIDLKVLFLNADPGFDAACLVDLCQKEEITAQHQAQSRKHKTAGAVPERHPCF